MYLLLLDCPLKIPQESPQSPLPPALRHPVIRKPREKVNNAIQTRIMRINKPDITLSIRILRSPNRVNGERYIESHGRFKERLIRCLLSLDLETFECRSWTGKNRTCGGDGYLLWDT